MTGVRPRRVLWVTSLGAFQPPFASAVISFSVPELGRALGASYLTMVWVPIAYLIPLAATMILFGKLSDTFGRVRFYLLGFLIFAVAAFLATLASGVELLVVATLGMGVGAALFSVNSTAIVSSAYPPESRGGALGVNAMSVYLGLTSGPIVSGVLLDSLGWRALFYLSAIFAVLSFAVAVAVLRHLDFARRPVPADLAGFGTFLASMLLIVLYFGLVEVNGWGPGVPVLLAGLVLLALFVGLERRRSEPMLDLSLFTRNRAFSAANLTAFLNYVSTFAIVFVFSIYFTVIAGLTPTSAALILTAEPVLMVVVSPLSGRWSDRVGSRGLASLGMLLISGAFFYLYVAVGSVPPTDLVYPLGVIGIGFGLFSAPNTNAVMGSVAKEDFGTAAGTLGTMRFVGQLMSIAVMGTLLAASMSHTMLLELFSGISSGVEVSDATAFLRGLRAVVFVAGCLSLVGVFTSLVRGTGSDPRRSGKARPRHTRAAVDRAVPPPGRR